MVPAPLLQSLRSVEAGRRLGPDHGCAGRRALCGGAEDRYLRDNRPCSVILSALLPQTILLADRGYDADWIRELARQQGAWANIPPKRNRKDPICFSPYLYRARNLIERFFNKIKQCRRVATDMTNSRLTIWRSSNSLQSELAAC